MFFIGSFIRSFVWCIFQSALGKDNAAGGGKELYRHIIYTYILINFGGMLISLSYNKQWLQEKILDMANQIIVAIRSLEGGDG